jgi:hypothetical protein
LGNLFVYALHSDFLEGFPFGYFLCIAISGQDKLI